MSNTAKGALALLWLTLACAGELPESKVRHRGDLDLLHERVLVETGDNFVARPGSIMMDQNRRVVIGDISHGAVLAFDSTGRFLWRLGSRTGSGPAEMIAPVALTAHRGTDLLVVDAALRRVVRWRPGRPEPVSSSGLNNDVFSIATSTDRMIGAVYGVADNISAIDLESGRSVGPELPVPTRSLGARTLLRHAVIDIRGNDVILAYPGIDSIYFGTIDARKLRAEYLPKRLRRGQRDWLLATLHRTALVPEDSAKVSWPTSIRFLGRDSVAILHLDADSQEGPSLYVSIVSPRVRIIDAVVPLESRDRVVASLTDSSVVVLEQLVTSADQPVSRIREFRFPREGIR